MNLRFLTIILSVLALLAAVQVAGLVRPELAPRVLHRSWLKLGDDLSPLAPVTPEGRPASLATGDTTVVLVFDPGCGHSLEVGPLWRDWIRAAGSRFSVIGVSSGELREAETFAREQGWEVEIWRVPAPTGSLGHALTVRSPWVFVLDGGGRILAEGIGSRIEDLPLGIRPHDRAVNP